MDSAVLTQDSLKRMIQYDKETGEFMRKNHPCFCKVRTKGKKPTCISHGYLVINIGRKVYLGHRLAWLYVYGYFPENQIDHINRDKLDNRICNLREVSISCNIKNSKLDSRNTSGVKGVSWHKGRKVWRATITSRKKVSHIGTAKDFVEAVALRLAGEQCVGWERCDTASPAYTYMQNYIKKGE